MKSKRPQNRVVGWGALVASAFFAMAPAAAFAKITLEVPFGNTSSVDNLGEYIALMYQFLVGAVGIVAVVMIMFAGIKWITAGGNQTMISDSKERIIGAFSGLAIALASYIILYALNPALVVFPAIAPTALEFEQDPFQDTGVSTAGQNACTEAGETPYEDLCNLTTLDSRYSSADFTDSHCPNNTFQAYGPAATAWNSMAQAFYEKYGKQISTCSTFRSSDYQACLRENCSSANGCYGAAEACTSNHNAGVAIDINQSGLTQAEYNFLVCGSESTCGDTGRNTVSYNAYGWKVLDYNADKFATDSEGDVIRLDEQHHFDYQSDPGVCGVCQFNVVCGCATEEEREEALRDAGLLEDEEEEAAFDGDF